MNSIKYIGFDADDTLWTNEPLYQSAEKKYCAMLSEFLAPEEVSTELYKTEKQNISIYGFGVKSFTLSMIETALRISNNKIGQSTISDIINLGKGILAEPVELLEGVKEVLESFSGRFKLIVATKGDLLDQERKLQASGLSKYFHHIEVMSDKKEENYQKLLDHLEIKVDEFVMIGNSLKSDIIPVVNLGAHAVYVPFHTTWQHEVIDENELNDIHYHRVDSVSEVVKLIR